MPSARTGLANNVQPQVEQVELLGGGVRVAGIYAARHPVSLEHPVSHTNTAHAESFVPCSNPNLEHTFA